MNHKVQQSSSLGIILSVACAIHCMLMPVLMLSFPLLNESILHNPMIEWMVLGILVLFGVVSLNHYRKEHHNNNLPLIMFAIGATMFLFALLIHGEFHHLLSIAGSLVIAVSHGINLLLKKAIA